MAGQVLMSAQFISLYWSHQEFQLWELEDCHNRGKELSFIFLGGAGLASSQLIECLMRKVINAWDEARCFTQEFYFSGVGLRQLIIPNQLLYSFL